MELERRKREKALVLRPFLALRQLLSFLLVINIIKDFKISSADLIGEKAGRISADYSLQHPPIGKGK